MWRTFRRRACDAATVWISRSSGRRWTDGREPISSSASNDRPNRAVHRANPAGASGRAVSGLIMLAHHPGPDVRGTIAKDNAFAGFVLSQEADGVTIGEDQVPQIQDNDATSRLGVD